jgi:hypothetical protein
MAYRSDSLIPGNDMSFRLSNADEASKHHRLSERVVGEGGDRMLKKFAISSFAGAVMAVGGSLVHPFGVIEQTGNAQKLLSQAQIDAGTLSQGRASVPELPF